MLLFCCVVVLSACWHVGRLLVVFVVVLCWCVGVLVCWCVGVLVCWCAGVLACRFVVFLVCWFGCGVVLSV